MKQTLVSVNDEILTFTEFLTRLDDVELAKTFLRTILLEGHSTDIEEPKSDQEIVTISKRIFIKLYTSETPSISSSVH